MLTDHLGSVVAITDTSGALVSQQRYLPFGGIRTNVASPNSQSLITDFSYTGQRNLDSGIGLMDYKFRFYSPTLNRFISPDTVTPGGPQGLNRFSYVGNNPINFNDPTGHVACQGKRWDDGPQCFGRTREERLKKLGLTIDEDMPSEYTSAIIAAAIDDGGYWAESMGGSAEGAFNKKHGDITIEYDPGCQNCRSVEAQAACGNRVTGTAQGQNCVPGGAVTDNAHHITIAPCLGTRMRESTTWCMNLVIHIIT